MNADERRKTKQELRRENEELRARLAEAEEVLRAIRNGEVDAFFVRDQSGERVLTLDHVETGHRILVETMNEGAAILKERGVLLYCNSRLAAMLNAPLESVIGTPFSCFISPADRANLDSLLEKGQAEACTAEVCLCRQGGASTPVHLALSPIRIHGQPGISLVAADLTEHYRLEEELRSLSLVDDLTGLFNRRGFLAVVQQQLKFAQRLKGTFLLMFADVDGLKEINDRLGHLEGDRALQDVADVLRKTFRDSDTIARLGGDEFTILAMGIPGVDSEILVHRLQRQLDAQNATAGRQYHLSMSVGVVPFDPETPEPINELLARADAAMYENKRRKRCMRASHVVEMGVLREAYS
jgi:diguanylate cyclase (GGDEF)-like protein/PAS domain S-box-containing protein